MSKKKPGWTNPQKALAAQACTSIGMEEDTRRFVLFQLGGHALIDGVATSKSKRLTDADFEKFMSIIESHAPGIQLIIGRKVYAAKHWEGQYKNGSLYKKRYRADKLFEQCRAAGVPENISGVISQASGRGIVDLNALDEDELGKVIEALKAVLARKKNAA